MTPFWSLLTRERENRHQFIVILRKEFSSWQLLLLLILIKIIGRENNHNNMQCRRSRTLFLRFKSLIYLFIYFIVRVEPVKYAYRPSSRKGA